MTPPDSEHEGPADPAESTPEHAAASGAAYSIPLVGDQQRSSIALAALVLGVFFVLTIAGIVREG